MTEPALCRCGHPKEDHDPETYLHLQRCLGCSCIDYSPEPHVNRNMTACIKCGAKWPKDVMEAVKVKTAWVFFCRSCWDES